MVARRTLQHERDHQKAAVLNHVLLHGLRRLDKLADEAQQLSAQRRIFLDVDALVGHVELGEQRKQDLDSADGVQCAVNRMCNHSFDVLQNLWRLSSQLRLV